MAVQGKSGEVPPRALPLPLPPQRSSAHAVSGMLSGLVVTTTLHPLDLIKTRLQVQHGRGLRGLAEGRHRLNKRYYTGTWNAFRTIVAREGALALYQGLQTNAVASAASWGLYFLFYSTFQRLLRERHAVAGSRLRPQEHLLAATAAGLTTTLCTNPLWVCKTRVQLQFNSERGAYRGVVHALRSTFAAEGVRGLYAGLSAALLGVMHGAVQFVFYEEFKERLHALKPADAALSTPEFLLASTSSKVIATVITYPYQVMKSRLQERPLDGIRKYAGLFDVFRKIWRSEGPLGFFKGLAPNLLRVTPGSALTLLLYEEFLRLHRFADSRLQE